MLHKGTTDGPRHKDLGRGFFWLDTIRSIRIDSSLEIDTIFRYVASALPPFQYATRDPWLTYYILTSTYRSTLYSTCVLVVVYKPYAHMYLCTVQCTTYYILSGLRRLA